VGAYRQPGSLERSKGVYPNLEQDEKPYAAVMALEKEKKAELRKALREEQEETKGKAVEANLERATEQLEALEDTLGSMADEWQSLSQRDDA